MDKNESIKEEISKLLMIRHQNEVFTHLQIYCSWPFTPGFNQQWTVVPVKLGGLPNSTLEDLVQDSSNVYGTGFTLEAALESLRSGIIQRMLDESLGTEINPNNVGISVVTKEVLAKTDVARLTHTEEGDVLDLNAPGKQPAKKNPPTSTKFPTPVTGNVNLEEYWKKRLTEDLTAETLAELRNGLPRGARGGADKTTSFYRIWAAANGRFNRLAARSAR